MLITCAVKPNSNFLMLELVYLWPVSSKPNVILWNPVEALDEIQWGTINHKKKHKEQE